MSLKYYPALKHGIFFALGILLSRLLDPSIPSLLAVLGGSLLLTFFIASYIRPLFPIALILLVGLSGGLLYQVQSGDSELLLQGLELPDAELIGVVSSDPVAKQGYVEWRIKPDSILWRNQGGVPEGEIVTRLYDSSATTQNVPLLGDHIALRGTFRIPSTPTIPGEFDYGGWLRSRGIAGTFDCYRRREIYRFGFQKPTLIGAMRIGVRRDVRSFTEKWIGGEEGDIAAALLIGDRSRIDPTTRDTFSATGTAHLLAVSGLHVGLIVLVLFVAVSWIPRVWIRFLCFALPLSGYVLIVGDTPSVLRAATMALLFLIAYNTGRLTRPINLLGGAALLLLLLRPSSLFDIGFQLSFSAVAGIFLVYTPLWNYLRLRFPRTTTFPILGRLLQLLFLSVGAQILTIPFTIYYFGYLSPISPVINLLAVPLISIGLGASLAGLAVPLAAKWFGGTAWLAIAAGRRLIEWAATLTTAKVELQTIGVLTLTVMLLGLLYVTFSRTPLQVLLRSISLCFLLFLSLTVDRRLDPLFHSSSGYLYLVPLSRSGGIATALHHNNHLTLWYGGMSVRDSNSAKRVADLLMRRTGAAEVEVIDILNDSIVRSSNDLLVVNPIGPEYGTSHIPLILTNASRRRPSLVEVAGEVYAQVPLQRKLMRTIILDSRQNWRRIEWDY